MVFSSARIAAMASAVAVLQATTIAWQPASVRDWHIDKLRCEIHSGDLSP
jgi:hypothetical protein